MEYTKGEWVADNGDSELWGIFQKEDCQGIAYLCEPDGTLLRPQEAKANAQLIASAPDLYEALKDIIEQAERTRMPLGADLADSIRVFGKSALAKAESK